MLSNHVQQSRSEVNLLSELWRTLLPVSPKNEAWNNFVLKSHPADYPNGDTKKAAAISKYYMNMANIGGINSFFTNSWELSTTEILEALKAVGANQAAEELSHILDKLGVPIPASSEEKRWALLSAYWTDELDALDCLSAQADEDLIRALEQHVQLHESFYVELE
jgi:Domain of unknown function (DUF4375)